MDMMMRSWILLFAGWMLFGSASLVCAQTEGEAEDLSVDQLYEKARTMAFDEGDYESARTYAYKALDRSPNYHGIRIFVARLYSWEEHYDKARNELEYVLERAPENYRALEALINTEQWSGDLDTALQLTNRALEHHPDDIELMLKKASVLYGMERYEQSEAVYLDVLAANAGERKAREGLKAVRLQQMKYQATVSYRYDRFREIFDPWHFTQIGLTRQTPLGSVTGRVEYARRFSSDGVQFNIDAYPSIANGLYAYISGGYSNASVYPKYRFGISLYKSLPSGFEVEAGMRYLDFVSSKTDLYTVSVTKYIGSYLLTARTFLVPSSVGTSKSINLVGRRYYGTADTYLSLNAGYGSAPTEIEFSSDVDALDSWSVSVDGQYPLTKTWFVGGNIGYDSSNYPNFKRQRFSAKVNISYRF